METQWSLKTASRGSSIRYQKSAVNIRVGGQNSIRRGKPQIEGEARSQNRQGRTGENINYFLTNFNTLRFTKHNK